MNTKSKKLSINTEASDRELRFTTQWKSALLTLERQSCWSDKQQLTSTWPKQDAKARNLPFAADWAATPNEDLEVALIVATRWLETLNYVGERCTSTQRLKWPRKVTPNVTARSATAAPSLMPSKKPRLSWLGNTSKNPNHSQASAAPQAIVPPLERTSNVKKSTCFKSSTTNSTRTSTHLNAATAPYLPSSKNSLGLRTCLAAGLAPTPTAATA